MPEYEALRARRDVFDEVAIYRSMESVLVEHDRSDVILADLATHGLMRVLRMAPAMGRWLECASRDI